MPITPDQTTFRRLQTDLPVTVTVFLSIDGTLVDGTPMPGPWQGIEIQLTQEEQAVAMGIVQRARVILADKINNPVVVKPVETVPAIAEPPESV